MKTYSEQEDRDIIRREQRDSLFRYFKAAINVAWFANGNNNAKELLAWAKECPDELAKVVSSASIQADQKTMIEGAANIARIMDELAELEDTRKPFARWYHQE